MDRWQNKIAVVTGASSCIGSAIAKDLINAGMIVIGLARTAKRIEDIREQLTAEGRQNLYSDACDVTDEKSINGAFDWIITKFGGVDVLVNNATIYKPGDLCAEDLEANTMGVISCTKRAFKSMKERNFNGHVVTTYAAAGHHALQARILLATKFTIAAITEVYKKEFVGMGSKVKVTCISPGLVDTIKVPRTLIEQCDERVLQPENIASAVLYTIATPPNVEIHEMIIRPAGEIL